MAVNKEKFNELLTKECATLTINKMFYLTRWTKTAINENCDRLQITCNNPIGAYSDRHFEIKARTFKDFLLEFSQVVNTYFCELAEHESKKAFNNAFSFKDIVEQ